MKMKINSFLFGVLTLVYYKIPNDNVECTSKYNSHIKGMITYLILSITVISRFQSNSIVLYLINCGNKSKSFLSFISSIAVSQHRVQVSCTSSHTSQF